LYAKGIFCVLEAGITEMSSVGPILNIYLEAKSCVSRVFIVETENFGLNVHFVRITYFWGYYKGKSEEKQIKIQHLVNNLSYHFSFFIFSLSVFEIFKN